mgnify:CR=1 FL=1
MAEVNKLKVNIGGNDYVLVSERPAEEMKQVADYVEQRVKESGSKNRRFNRTMQATLACVNMADELFTSKAERRSMSEALEEGRDRISRLEEELDTLKEEARRSRQSNADLHEDLKVLHENLSQSEEKLLDLAKQFQEYQRTHK